MKLMKIECLYNTGEAIEFETYSMKYALRVCKWFLGNEDNDGVLGQQGVVCVNGKPCTVVGKRPTRTSYYAHHILKGA